MQIRFLNEPQLRPLAGATHWELTADFLALLEGDPATPPGAPDWRILIVPAGFETDLASVPRLPGAYLLFAGRARRSAILHDWLYDQRHPRAWADAVFRAAMAAENVAPLTRWAMWAGVRLGGAGIYAERATTESDPYHPQ